MSGSQTRRSRSREGKKWVGLNQKEKERAKEANGQHVSTNIHYETQLMLHRRNHALHRISCDKRLPPQG